VKPACDGVFQGSTSHAPIAVLNASLDDGNRFDFNHEAGMGEQVGNLQSTKPRRSRIARIARKSAREMRKHARDSECGY
jgi:hypothetical protein